MACGGDDNDKLSLDSIRDSLIRQEDTIIFNLIERIKYPINSIFYQQPSSSNIPCLSGGSLFHYLFQQTEALQAKVGRYLSPEENPFFPNNLPDSIIPPTNFTPALSRRIHYGKFVAEVKFMDCTDEYKPFILAQDRDALMKLLTFEAVEEMVKKRVAKKAKVFGQEITSNDCVKEAKGKVDPSLVSRLYDEWIMPLTKLVEVEYLLRRLD
ncbi:chorismate mutase [Datura stramonium]|uniref:chorismate mutase n=1 Tax=Datura stramonium TaxID=4076 RepID=A0ABS8UKM3_DATST|nr:chorismate mutase [Datura stramonium]